MNEGKYEIHGVYVPETVKEIFKQPLMLSMLPTGNLEAYEIGVRSYNDNVINNMSMADKSALYESQQAGATKLKANADDIGCDTPNTAYVKTPDGREVSLNPKPFIPQMPNGTVSGQSALSLFGMVSGTGGTTTHLLPNTGIYITMSDIKDAALVAAQAAIDETVIRYGLDTLTLGFSIQRFMFHKIFMRMLRNNISATTFNLTGAVDEPDADIFNYISILDIDNIYMLALSVMHPSGMEYSRLCVNALQTNAESNGLKCNNIISVLMNPNNMVVKHIDRILKLGKDDDEKNFVLKMLSTRQKNAVNIDDVKRYQSIIKQKENRVQLPVSDENKELYDMYAVIDIPSINKYIAAGDYALAALTDAVDALFTHDSEPVTLTVKSNRIKNVADTAVMSRYLPYIQKIVIQSLSDDTVTTIEDIDSIWQVLQQQYGDKSLASEFTIKVDKVLQQSSLTDIGIRPYVCPACNKLNDAPDGENETEIKLIPLDALNLFLEACARRIA